ncbi:pyruvate, water dikinase regulatory protein [Paenibacillus cisolokensis]|uniref:Putative pyruvate, phosphate dikinase regulatory protein n=1 Tax=Paenibacillus cisolokensis TaxID=1658519 RepID=A0ABQ4N9T8_9BACL|nr:MULTISPECIES: pyruvate, water dikinase regulatory protein [Paenibacillus]ALS29550.1 phosphotransferase [Paenibacillus sp. 32O-W]GIQ65010.1 phosphoenolpyruvate synthase regulatory protein [Paenibacillus cisolokensis]
MNEPIIYICSDAVGETAEAVAKATLRQFPSDGVRLKRYGHIKTEDEIIRIVAEAARTGGFIAFTLVQPELREMMREEAQRRGVRAVDVMGPMLQAYVDTFGSFPKREPGLLHSMDDAYFRRIEAIEFAVKYDDGKDVRGLVEAEVVLIGVSRTSKTPLSIFLSHKGIKVANLPLMPEVKPPVELIANRDRLIVGLQMQHDHLLRIRSERLRSLGLPFGSQYASAERIAEELAYADEVMASLGCPVIDVTNRAIEETAGIIIDWLNETA